MAGSPQYASVGDRKWTAPEANAALEQVKPMLSAARKALAAVRDEEDQVRDIEIVYGDDVREEGHEGHSEWAVRKGRLDRARSKLAEATQAFDDMGIVLKDIDLGLVDFPADHAGKTVFLCWRAGEPRIHSWHPVDKGFAGRRPLPDVQKA